MVINDLLIWRNFSLVTNFFFVFFLFILNRNWIIKLYLNSRINKQHKNMLQFFIHTINSSKIYSHHIFSYFISFYSFSLTDLKNYYPWNMIWSKILIKIKNWQSKKCVVGLWSAWNTFIQISYQNTHQIYNSSAEFQLRASLWTKKKFFFTFLLFGIFYKYLSIFEAKMCFEFLCSCICSV